jgi:hypothetical protein
MTTENKLREVLTTNLRQKFGEVLTDSDLIPSAQLLYNYRSSARRLGYDLWSWNDAEISKLNALVFEFTINGEMSEDAAIHEIMSEI